MIVACLYAAICLIVSTAGEIGKGFSIEYLAVKFVIYLFAPAILIFLFLFFICRGSFDNK